MSSRRVHQNHAHHVREAERLPQHWRAVGSLCRYVLAVLPATPRSNSKKPMKPTSAGVAGVPFRSTPMPYRAANPRKWFSGVLYPPQSAGWARAISAVAPDASPTTAACPDSRHNRKAVHLAPIRRRVDSHMAPVSRNSPTHCQTHSAHRGEPHHLLQGASPPPVPGWHQHPASSGRAPRRSGWSPVHPAATSQRLPPLPSARSQGRPAPPSPHAIPLPSAAMVVGAPRTGITVHGLHGHARVHCLRAPPHSKYHALSCSQFPQSSSSYSAHCSCGCQSAVAGTPLSCLLRQGCSVHASYSPRGCQCFQMQGLS